MLYSELDKMDEEKSVYELQMEQVENILHILQLNTGSMWANKKGYFVRTREGSGTIDEFICWLYWLEKLRVRQVKHQ